MANQTLEVVAENIKDSKLPGCTAQECTCKPVKCNDCGRLVKPDCAYHSAVEDTYYCLGACLSQYLDTVA
jgi:hypothetical protein